MSISNKIREDSRMQYSSHIHCILVTDLLLLRSDGELFLWPRLIPHIKHSLCRVQRRITQMFAGNHAKGLLVLFESMQMRNLFLISNFCHVLNVVFFLLDNSPACASIQSA